MSRAEIISEIPKLSRADRREIMRCILEVEGSNSIDLRTRGIDETQAAELRARLKTFAEDWERPEADIYDQEPAR
ncbi:MAG: hypothetical protein WBW41_02635 [Verrucomicrobiia bacterium]